MNNPVNFFMVGGEKCGTTWFYFRLDKHPEVFLPSAKEIGYFNSLSSNHVVNRSYEEQSDETYLKNFDGFNREKICGEIMPMYLCDKDAPRRIHQFAPNSKILISLRNPVDRAYSHYWMAMGKEMEHRSFQEVFESEDARMILRGLYGQQVKQYHELFGKENVHVIFYEEFFKDPQANLNPVCNFLGIDYGWFEKNPVDNERENAANEIRNLPIYNFGMAVSRTLRKSSLGVAAIDMLKASGVKKKYKDWIWKTRTYEPLSDDLRSRVNNYYAEDWALLEDEIGRKLPWS